MNTKNIAKATKKNDTKSESNISRNLNDVFQLPPVLHNQIKIIRTNDTCFKDYSILGSLGKGTYAQVWKVKNKITNEIFAAKLLQPSQFPKESFNRIVEMFTKEIINLSICQCPGVVKLHKVIGGTEGWVLIQDYVNDGTLWKENLTNSMEEAFLYFIQLFQGMCYIQDMNIVHRDLKPTNILKHDNKKIVIADFGWSEHVDSCNLHPSEWPGTLEINPPEVLRNTGPMTEKIDNYALGMNMILFVSGRFVCRQKGVECSKVAQTILKTVHNLRHSKPPSKFRSNMKAWDLFVKLTCSNPNERISLEKVLYHPWVTEMLNSLSIQNSRFIWYEKVKSRWIYLLSNNWNFLRNMSAAPKNYKQLPAEQSSVPKGETGNKIHIDNNIKKNSSDDTRKAQHVEIHCNNKQEEKTTSVVDAHKESDCKDMFTLTKTNYKNKREECSTQKKEDIPVDKLRTGETTVALSPKERNKDLERGKEKDRTREVPNKTMICEKDAKFTCEKKDEIIKKNIKEQCRYNCEKTTMLNAYGNKSKEQIKTNDQNENEADEDDDEEYEEDEEEDDDEDDDEDDEEDEEEEEDDDEVEEKEECGSKLRKQNIANKLCTNNDKFKNPITNYYKHTKVHQLLQVDPTNAETTENRKLSNKIDNSFLNFVEKKNLNIPKNLMKNDSLEENNTLAEKTFEENSSKNKERSINYENNSHFNCTKNHDAYIKVLTKNFQASKLKVPQMFYDSFVKGAHSKDMSSLFGHSENLKKSRNEVQDKGKTKGDIFNQKEETSKNKLKINTNELYPDINLKGSFEKLDMHLKKEMEKIEKAQKNKKDVNKEKLFSCIKEHNHISEINVDSLGDMKKYIIDDKIKNIMPSENYKNENVKEGDKQNDNESIPDVYENIIEKCLKKTNEKAFSKYGELSEKKKVNTKNCFVHKLFNENVELTLDNRNEEKERTDAKYMEQYIIAKKKIGDNFSRNEHNNRYTFNKNETNTDKNKTELLKESGLDVNKYENFNRYLFKHNKNKEDNNRVLYQSTGKLRPTCVENLFEKFGTNNKKDIDNYGGSNNNRSLASKAKIYKNTVAHGNNNNKDNQGSDFMKNLSFLSNECNNNYSTKSKVSSSTFNSNVSSDVNNSIIDNFVNNTKKDKTDGVYHNGYFNILREKNSAEHKKSNSFLNISQTTQKTNTCATKSQELITTDMSACKTKWDLNRKSKFVAKFIPYDQNSMDSVKTDSNDGSKIEERNGIKYVGKKTECKNIMKETDKNENAFFKLSNPNKCNETILEDFSEKFLKNKIDDTANNERMKPAEINEKKHLYYQLMNNPHYQKLMNTYNEEPSSTFLNKLTNKEHKTNAYADNDIGKNNTNDNNKSNIYQYMNSQISNTNNYTKSTLYLNDNSKEHIGKTSSASTFECSDFDAHYSSNKELIESFNSDHNFLTKDKYSFENKKKPEKIFAQFK